MDPKIVDDLLPLSAVDFLVLMILIDGEGHGYGIVQELARRTDGKTRLLPGNFYAVLRRLIRDGLIAESVKRPADDLDDKRRRYYRITPFGRQVASAEAERMQSLVREAADRNLVGGETA